MWAQVISCDETLPTDTVAYITYKISKYGSAFFPVSSDVDIFYDQQIIFVKPKVDLQEFVVEWVPYPTPRNTDIFIFFDDFDGDTLSSSWVVYANGNVLTLSNSILTIDYATRVRYMDNASGVVGWTNIGIASRFRVNYTDSSPGLHLNVDNTASDTTTARADLELNPAGTNDFKAFNYTNYASWGVDVVENVTDWVVGVLDIKQDTVSPCNFYHRYVIIDTATSDVQSTITPVLGTLTWSEYPYLGGATADTTKTSTADYEWAAIFKAFHGSCTVTNEHYRPIYYIPKPYPVE